VEGMQAQAYLEYVASSVRATGRLSEGVCLDITSHPIKVGKR
jgi:hypothetical protein